MSGSKPRLGYLLSKYPAVSHTFFLKEVLGMRARGWSIGVASINPPDRAARDLSAIERAKAAETFYIKGGSKFAALLSVMGIILRHPAVALRGLGFALRLGGWDLKAQAFALFYLAEALMVGDWMQRRSIARLHTHFGGPVASVGLLTAIAWRVPWSLSLHGPDEFFDVEPSYLRQKIETAEFVICISDFCLSQVIRIVPEADARCEVVRLGVECDRLGEMAAARPAEPAYGDTLRLICTGRLVAAKGHRILLRAVAAAIAGGATVTLTLVGDGPERGSLEALAGALGIAGSVDFRGAMAHQQALEAVAEADVFVLASFAEGLPVALMEAMALSVPCISTPIAAITELIQDGKNGMLVPPANVAALQAAIEGLAGDPALRRRLGQAARATVEANYDLARNLDRLAAVWNVRLQLPETGNWS